MPRRILFLSTSPSPVLDIIKDLTGSAPAPALDGSTAGLTHEWHAQTAYYSTRVPIWVDEIQDVQAWKEEFLKEEAAEVVSAVGAWVYCFPAPRSEHEDKSTQNVEEVMRCIHEIVERHGGGESISIAVAVNEKIAKSESLKMDAEEWEDRCTEFGFEFVDYAATGKNDHGERVGFERLKEALEANEWDEDDAVDGDDFLGMDDLELADDLEGSGFNREEAEMTAELFGMKAALYGNDEFDEEDNEPSHASTGATDDQPDPVDDLDRMMSKLLAVKEQSADLPEAQRKRMAAKAVRELMSSNGGL
ncbi:alpha/gamma-adaptin-binding protein p34 [Zymoseptoria brevis]|uniref:Alpha/gamma-adaptin-binding protein p34 n=1 Tax=Zymoseptoria brevis TaxID=1047168 RepID=A0A0F4GG03_9PEZI|nr:alpha/gamma-adaptin-binding protein p34 [Zymoseptoria brevis]